MICKECGSEINLHYREDVKERLARLSLCHKCDHWNGQYQISLQHKLSEGQSLRIDGVHYRIAPEDRPGPRGFGGSRFTFVLEDGTQLESSNVWCQGEIPEHWKSRLPDNARMAGT